jgi:glycosyltransferase involved in cell wall biosynthesis
MKIAIFTELYSPSIGGQEMFFKGLGRELIGRGHEVDVYCIGHEAGLLEEELIDGVRVHRFPIAPNYKSPSLRVMRRDWWQIIRYAWRMRQVSSSGRYDYYLLNEFPLFHILMMSRSARRQTLLHWCEIRQSRFYRLVQRLLPPMARLNAAISAPVAASIHDAAGVEVFVLPSGLDLSRAVFQERDKRSDLVVLGRVTEHKNLEFLVEAFELLKARGYAGRLKIAGDGPAMPAVRAKVAASPAREAIDLLGFISDDQKFELLANCEVLAMPSKREGFPHVISEAMCSGLPVVTADYPENGAKDVVAMYDVGVISGQSPAQFAESIELALANWDHYAANGRRVAQTLGWPAIAENLETKISESLGRIKA